MRSSTRSARKLESKAAKPGRLDDRVRRRVAAKSIDAAQGRVVAEIADQEVAGSREPGEHGIAAFAISGVATVPWFMFQT